MLKVLSHPGHGKSECCIKCAATGLVSVQVSTIQHSDCICLTFMYLINWRQFVGTDLFVSLTRQLLYLILDQVPLYRFSLKWLSGIQVNIQVLISDLCGDLWHESVKKNLRESRVIYTPVLNLLCTLSLSLPPSSHISYRWWWWGTPRLPVCCWKKEQTPTCRTNMG